MSRSATATTTAEYMASQSEAVFQQAVVNLAKRRGWRVAHFRPAITRSGKWATHMQGHKGFPDLVLAREGRVLFLELKSAKGTVSADQRAWLEALPAGQAFVLRPGQWESVEEMLR